MAQGQQMCSEELPSWQLPHPRWSPSGTELQGTKVRGGCGGPWGTRGPWDRPHRGQGCRPGSLGTCHPSCTPRLARSQGTLRPGYFHISPGAGVNIVSAPVFQVKKQTLTWSVAAVMPVCAGSPVCPSASLIKTLVTALRACLVTLTVSFAM